MKKQIIGLSGLIGSGKNTAAAHLEKSHGFVQLSFAEAVKDCLSVIFHWDRNLLEGDTIESRQWREKVDPYWEKKLKIPGFSPRMAMQRIATDLFRDKFNDFFWIYSLEKRMLAIDKNIVISDCRFPNEIAMLRSNGASIVRIARGSDPQWYGVAKHYPEKMKSLYPEVHASEWSWAQVDFDTVIDNTSTIEDFLKRIDQLVL